MDEYATVYVSPDGNSEMPVRSAEARINLEHRGWRRKDDGPAAMTGPAESTEQPTRRQTRRRETTDE